MRGINRERLAAEIQLHGIARPYFDYPPIEENAWYIPQVSRWEAYNPEPSASLTRTQRKLVGALVVPSLVEWQVLPHIYMGENRRRDFKLHLQQRTGSRWDLDWTKLPRNVVIGERLSSTMLIEQPELMTTTRVDIPALPHPERRLYSGIAHGLFRDEWRRRRIETNRYREEDGA